ncbi:MAG TPA: DUF1844 domain-containing protein [Candidatus Latescibacteria bacterium]|nr:DUF1844 domain-containing protein [Candidatus Latescibacterota bacterium]
MAEQDAKLTQEQQDTFAFMAMVELYQQTAWMALGKIADPATKETKANLPQARWAIDTLAMIERKTRGNLSDQELRFLREILHMLRMNYVEEANKPVGEPPSTQDKTETKPEKETATHDEPETPPPAEPQNE